MNWWRRGIITKSSLYGILTNLHSICDNNTLSMFPHNLATFKIPKSDVFNGSVKKITMFNETFKKHNGFRLVARTFANVPDQSI